jgi:hypothetical protein
MKPSFRTKYFSVLIFTVTIALLSSIFSDMSNTQSSEPATPTQSCCGQFPDQPHLLAALYYKVGNNMTATLMLNNKGSEPVEVKPTLFSLTGERLEVAPVTFRWDDLG